MLVECFGEAAFGLVDRTGATALLEHVRMSSLGKVTVRVTALAAACASIWVVVELTRGSAAHYVLRRGGPDWEIVVTPGRPMAILYGFLVLVTLIPPVSCAGLLRSASGVAARTVYVLLFGAGVALASFAAGYGYEALQSEVRLNGQGLVYRRGSDTAAMPWDEVGAMVLHWKRRGQVLVVQGQGHAINIDLAALSSPDQVLVIRSVQELGHLVPLRRTSGDAWVWRKALPAAPPE